MAYENYAGAWLPESVQNVSVNGSASGTTYYGGNSNNVWGVTGANDTLVGGSHDDFYWLTGPSQVPVEQPGGGTDTVQIWQNYALPANIENLTVFGDGQYAAGNDQDNIIKATAAHDVIYGGRGEDVFVGSGSGTTYDITLGEGDKVIQNWTEGKDTLHLTGGPLTSFSAVQAAMIQKGADVDLNDGGTHILLRNTTIGQFQASDFQLPMNPASLGAMSFDEEFDNPATIGANWQPAFGSANQLGSYTLPRNGEQEIYTNANFTGTSGAPLGLNPFSFNNGVLTISATPVSAAQSAAMWGYQYSSGMLESNAAQTYGYFDVRAELPQGQGLWPAFWLLGDNNKEIDVFEILGSDLKQVNNAVHSPADPAQGNVAFDPSPSGFHDYGVLWDPQHITYYLDGTPVWQIATPSDMNTPMRMILNLAVGGNWPGSPDATTSWPAQMKLDYVHVYGLDQVNAGGAPVTAPPVTAPPVTAPPVTTPVVTPPATASGGGAAAGQALVSAGFQSTLAGGAGNDTLTSTQGGETMSGGAGADVFVVKTTPWTPIHVTDFQVGVDRLDLSGLYQGGYAGADPIADGYVSLASDGHGGTEVLVDVDGRGTANPWPAYVMDLEGVAPTGLTSAQLFGGQAASGGAGGATPPAAGGSSGGGSAGQALVSAGFQSTLAGGAGADTLTSYQGGETMSGGGGADVFAVKTIPWTPIHVTDFQVGVDRLDFSGLYQGGYAGADPIADGYVSLASDGRGGTEVLVDVDGHGTANPWPAYVMDLEGVSPSGLTSAQLFGGQASSGGGMAPSAPAAAGQALTSSGFQSTLAGGAGNDTLTSYQGGETMSGGAGDDIFVFNATPWTPTHITDFDPTHDKLDLRKLLIGYAGSNPVADGYVSLADDGHGGTEVLVDPDGHGAAHPWPDYVVDLQGVSRNSLSGTGWLVH